MLKNKLSEILKVGKISKSSYNSIESFLFAFCIFMLTPPYYVWKAISPIVFVVLCILLTLKHIKRNSLKHYVTFLFIIFIYIYIAFKSETNIFGIINLTGICTIFLISEQFLNNVFKNYISIYSISLIPSICVYFLVYVLGIDISYSHIEPLNHLKSYNYLQYPFLVQANNVINIILPQFFGYYDEPGVIGTVSGVILVSSRFNLKKMINIPVFIAGILSFSFAFYVIVLVYGLLFFKLKYKLLIAIITIGIVILFSENEILNNYVFNRFEYKDGKLVGDNRSMDKGFDSRYSQYMKSDDFYFGLGLKASQEFNRGGASYKDLIISYGIITFIFFISIFILLAFWRFQLKIEFLVYILILLAVLYQRPFISSYFYVFLIYAPISFLAKLSTNK